MRNGQFTEVELQTWIKLTDFLLGKKVEDGQQGGTWVKEGLHKAGGYIKILKKEGNVEGGASANHITVPAESDDSLREFLEKGARYPNGHKDGPGPVGPGG